MTGNSFAISEIHPADAGFCLGCGQIHDCESYNRVFFRKRFCTDCFIKLAMFDDAVLSPFEQAMLQKLKVSAGITHALMTPPDLADDAFENRHEFVKFLTLLLKGSGINSYHLQSPTHDEMLPVLEFTNGTVHMERGHAVDGSLHVVDGRHSMDGKWAVKWWNIWLRRNDGGLLSTHAELQLYHCRTSGRNFFEYRKLLPQGREGFIHCDAPDDSDSPETKGTAVEIAKLAAFREELGALK